MDKPPADLLETAQNLASALAPAAIGAAVAQAWEKGLSWTQRVVQWAVGICVSYYVTGAAAAVLGLDRFVAQAVGFVIAMIAFKATPRFIESASSVFAGLPAAIAEKIGIKPKDSQ